jgi:type II secretory pathway component GspD/PulD (secretin)
MTMRKFATALFAAALLAGSTGPLALAQTALTIARPVTPLQLKPLSNAPITMHLVDDSKTIYLAIGKTAGLNILFDSDYVSKHVPVDLTNVSLSDALRIVGEITGTFYIPLTPDTIFVVQNTRAKHNDLDELYDEMFYLKNATQQADANEVVAALRNLLPPEAKVYLVNSEDAIVIRTTPDQLVRAQKVLNDLDLPKKAFRLTYTVTEVDAGKRVGTQHFSMVTASGQNTKLKQGSKAPIATGSYNATAGTQESPRPVGLQTQFTYIDVGMNFDATLTAMGEGAMLKSDVVQSSLAPETSGVGPQDPIIRQTELQGVFYLTNGKPLVIGSLDIPGTTRRLDIEVLMEPLP